MGLLLLALAAIILPMLIGQWGETLLGAQDRHEHLKSWVLVGVARQGLLGAAVCLPLFWSRRRAPFLIIPFLLAIAPDFDHMMAAKERWQSLTGGGQIGGGPAYVPLGTHDFTHSLALIYIAAGVLLVLTQRLDWAWVLAMARTSHILRSAHTAPLAIFYPNPTLHEIDLWTLLYCHAAMGALTFGVMFIHEPVSAFLRRVMRVGIEPLVLMVPHRTPPDWVGGVPVAPKSSSRQHSSHSSGSAGSSRSSRRHRHSHGEKESHHHSSSRSHAHRRSKSSGSSHDDSPSGR